MQIFVDQCAYPEFIYLVPCSVEVPIPRYRTDEQKLRDAYLDAIIPASFKNTLLEDTMPLNKAVDVAWDKQFNQLEANMRVRAWLVPNDFCVAREKRLIMDITLTMSVRNPEEVIKHALSNALIHRKSYNFRSAEELCTTEI